MDVTTMKYPYFVSDITGKSNYSSDEQSINECLRLLFLSCPGELLGDPNFGCRLKEQLFLPNIEIYDSLIKQEMLRAVARYEKRIYMNENYIDIIREDSKVNLVIRYKIKNSGMTKSLTLQVLEGE